MSALTTDDAVPVESTRTPAVLIRKSVTPDYLICLEDGSKLKMLKRHLQHDAAAVSGAKWGLKPDYPMVAPNYARTRQERAKKIGLGRKPRVMPPPAPKATRSRRKTAA